MKTELVDVNETRRNLTVEIPPMWWTPNRAGRPLRQGRAPSGVPSGKVPSKVVRQRFRSQILHDVAHELVERAVEEALTERGVEPVATPDIRDINVEEGQPLTFKAEFDVLPSFDPGEFSAIEARRSTASIEDAAVDQALEQLRERAARFEPVEEGVVGDGHTVTRISNASRSTRMVRPARRRSTNAYRSRLACPPIHPDSMTRSAA